MAPTRKARALSGAFPAAKPSTRRAEAPAKGGVRKVLTKPRQPTPGELRARRDARRGRVRGDAADAKAAGLPPLEVVDVFPSEPSPSQPPASLRPGAPLPRVDRHGLLEWDAESDAEVLLKKFDMDLRFGPCVGLSRRERWERAHALGLAPPQHVLDILDARGESGRSLWQDRV